MKPILFNASMVRAILDGRKTQTRRIMKPQPELVYTLGKQMDAVNPNEIAFKVMEKGGRDKLAIPPYQPGDIIWVRETWLRGDDGYHYKANATNTSEELKKAYGYKWRPSIHMPKEAARIFLKVTDVSVEKLQDISPSDCICEGIDSGDILTNTPDGDFAKYAISQYARFWDDLHAKRGYGWDANPWVWVYEFEWIEGGQDE